MAALPIILAVVSTGVAVAGGVQAQRAAKAQAAAQKRAGEVEAADQRRETRRLLAAQQVAFIGGGVDPGVGTPLDVLGDTVAERELEALRIQFGRAQQAAGLRSRGQTALISGITSGLGTILGAAGSLASSSLTTVPTTTVSRGIGV